MNLLDKLRRLLNARKAVEIDYENPIFTLKNRIHGDICTNGASFVSLLEMYECGNISIDSAISLEIPKLAVCKDIFAPYIPFLYAFNLRECGDINAGNLSFFSAPEWKKGNNICLSRAVNIVAPKVRATIYCSGAAEVDAPKAEIKRGNWAMYNGVIREVAPYYGR